MKSSLACVSARIHSIVSSRAGQRIRVSGSHGLMLASARVIPAFLFYDLRRTGASNLRRLPVSKGCGFEVRGGEVTRRLPGHLV